MRTFVLFALTLAGTATVADSAEAGPFRRNRDRDRGGMYSSNYGSDCSCSGGYGSSYGPGWQQGHAGMYTGPHFDGTRYYVQGADGTLQPSVAGAANAKASTIQGTDGTIYTLGSDGSYYQAGAGVTTMGGFTTQPYYGTQYQYRGGNPYRSGYYSYPQGVYPAGYPGNYYGPGVVPAGGNNPLTMPGTITLPGGVTIVPPRPMPNK